MMTVLIKIVHNGEPGSTLEGSNNMPNTAQMTANAEMALPRRRARTFPR